MPAIDRKSALCAQTALSGIDFIQVVEPLVQDRLRVFFVVEPQTLDLPMVNGGALIAPVPPAEAGPVVNAPGLDVRIESVESGLELAIDSVGWRLVAVPSGLRVALEIALPAPGDFGLYRLHIDDARIDPFFNGLEFSFKQGCPSPFDCRTDCEPEPGPCDDVDIDYLARDFWSLRRALLDFARARYPGWSEALEADQAVMLMELMAALGDEFAYTQDRYVREAALSTATQRRSRHALARLVDYLPDPGHAAETELALWVDAAVEQPLGARIWALPEGESPLPFSATAPLWTHPAWNAIALHQPDADIACLPKGATHAYLLAAVPLAAQLPPGSPLSPAEFWQGRRAVLRSRPSDPSEPTRAHAITIHAVEGLVDSLAPTPGIATAITRIDWDEPLPWPLPLAETEFLGNVLQVQAGEQITERFRIGPDAELLARFPLLTEAEQRELLALPRAVEREGPYQPDRGGRGRILRYGLRASETRGLGWTGERHPLGLDSLSADLPMIELDEVLPPLHAPDPAAAGWSFARDLLASDVDAAHYTLEEGLLRTVVTHQTPFEDIAFDDYAANAGYSLRFGDGEFGRSPDDASVFEVRYFSAPGTRANLAADSLTHLAPPLGASPGPMLLSVTAATNPLAIDSGRDEESADSIRIDAPEAFRALPLRAVRSEDYEQILERLPWVQRASATTRWTGSWPTDFVAADPLNGFALTEEQRAELGESIDCIRLATRDARALDPDYVDIDLEVEICVRATAYPGQVIKQVIRALAPPGLFHPDNFSFGQGLKRSAIEAAVQAVPGVRGVESMRVRVRRRRDWQDFNEAELSVGPAQILRLQNDPRLPGRGSLSVHAHGGAA
jgi:hypothetical protein